MQPPGKRDDDMRRCKSCGAPIVWIKMAGGKSMPCDADQVLYWQQAGGSQKIVTPNGEVLSAELRGDPDKATGIGYISHFATCPNADQHRRR